MDQAVEFETPEIVSHLPGLVVGCIHTQQSSHAGTQVSVAKAVGKSEKQTQSVHERHGSGFTKAKPGHPLMVNGQGTGYSGKHFFSDQAIVTEALDVEKTSVGGKADAAQCRQITQSTIDPEVLGVVDHGLRSEGAALFEVLLNPGHLVVDVE